MQLEFTKYRPLLRDTVMITQNVTRSNEWKVGYKNGTKF